MRLSWVLAGVALALAGCGGTSEPNRLDLTTPGVHTGDPVPTTTAPEATATPGATPEPASKKVTKAEKRVIKGWSDSLRDGRVNAASKYFKVPSAVSNNTPGLLKLASVEDVRTFNRTLPCGAKLLRTRRITDGFVVGVFRLTERKHAPVKCGTGVGEEASVAFKIVDEHITTWVRVVAPAQTDPMATPTPTPTPSAPNAGDPDVS
jgi:hypothetical protein